MDPTRFLFFFFLTVVIHLGNGEDNIIEDIFCYKGQNWMKNSGYDKCRATEGLCFWKFGQNGSRGCDGEESAFMCKNYNIQDACMEGLICCCSSNLCNCGKDEKCTFKPATRPAKAVSLMGKNKQEGQERIVLGGTTKRSQFGIPEDAQGKDENGRAKLEHHLTKSSSVLTHSWTCQISASVALALLYQ